MKWIFSLIIASLSFFRGSDQNVICNEICNKTESYNFFFRASSGINDFLLKRDSSGFEWVTFSSKSKITKAKLAALSDTLNKLLSRYDMKAIFLNNTIDVNLNNSLWHERNYFTIDPSTKKLKQLVQVMVLFEGNDVRKELDNPKVLDVYIVSGTRLKDRGKYLLKKPSFEPPPSVIKKQ